MHPTAELIGRLNRLSLYKNNKQLSIAINMVRKIIGITSLLLLLFVSEGYAQWLNKEEANLKGEVRSIKTNHLKIQMEGDSIWGEIAEDSDPFWFKGYVDEAYSFDREGRTLEYHAYFTDDADDNKTQNIYNKNGILTEQRYFADRRKTGRITYDYDEEGRITLVTRYDEKDNITDLIYHLRNPHETLPLHRSSNNIWIYRYNAQGKCSEEKCLFPDGRTNFRHLFFYDQNGRQTQMISFDSQNNQQSSQSYRYTPNGKISSIRYVSPVKSRITNYWFDAEGNETKCHITETDLQEFERQSKATPNTQQQPEERNFRSITETSSKYIYDDNGNWTERYVFLNGEPQFMQKREVIYWK